MTRGAGDTGDDALDADPFAWRTTADRRVLVSRAGRQVAVVGGAAGARLADRLDAVEEVEAQRLLARATGNYRRGNERR